MAGTPRVMVLEDHPLVREALVDRLVEQLGPIELKYAGDSIHDALASAGDGADCVLLDLDLNDNRSPIANVLALTERELPVLVVSALGDPAMIRGALTAGALGFVSKQASVPDLIAAVRATLDREPFTSPEVAAAVLDADDASVMLSEQERRAMVLYASGMKMAAVARRMQISTGTAQEYIKRVRAKYEKAGNPLPTKTDLYRQARGEGFMP